MFKSIRYSCFFFLKFLNKTNFDCTAKYLVTNTVVITRVLCTMNSMNKGYHNF